MNTFLSRRLLSVAAVALTLPAAALAAPVAFDLPVQSLETSLKAVASMGGLNLVATRSLLTGKAAPALKGTFEPAEALRRLLAGSGLTVSVTDSNAVVTQQTGEITLEPVKVADTKTPASGSAAAGYLVTDTTAAGPIWGNMKLQDAPYSMSVISSDLIDNLQIYNPEDLARVVPQITNVSPQQNRSGNPFYYIRGFSVTNFTNNGGVTYDGLQGWVGGVMDTVLEDKERVEVLSGVNGFLYGVSSVGGNLNYVLKRPTDTPYNSITVGDNAGMNGYVHGDFGGPIGDKFGYRINIVKQDGDTEWKDQGIDRELVSLAFDVKPTDDLKIQFNAADSDYRVRGETPSFISTGLYPLIKPADPSTLFNPSWDEYIDHTDNAGVKVTYTFNKTFTLRSFYDYTFEKRPSQIGVNQKLTSYNGSETVSIASISVPQHWATSSGYTFLDSAFDTFGIEHKLTTGFTGDLRQAASSNQSYQVSPSSGYSDNLYNQVNIPQPRVYYNVVPGVNSERWARNWVIGDEIKFDKHFSLLAGGNLASIASHSYTNGVLGTGAYNSSALTPSVAGLYKPVPWITTYVSYQQSLQGGSTVVNDATHIYTNAGEILPPYLGDQYEVGVKATLSDNLMLTAAVFDIDKAYQYMQQNNGGRSYTYIQDGTEDHKGIEMTATGNIEQGLRLIAGATFLDPKVEDSKVFPQYNGSTPSAISKQSAKFYTEYDLPFVPGLTVIGGVQYNSAQQINFPNNGQKLPWFMVGDVGLRYASEIYGTPTIFRLNIYNVTNEAYWQTANYEGNPRTFLGTVQVKF